MTSLTLTLGLVILTQARAPAMPETAADTVILRDGTIVLGQVADSATRGPLMMYVRRSWAEANIPEQARRWEAAELPERRRAERARRERMASWRRERSKEVGGVDRISPWLDRQVLAGDPPQSPLLVFALNRAEVKSVVRRTKGAGRMLRQGWLSGFADVETMKLAELKEALEGRGFAVGSEEAVPIDRLLPIPTETEEQWLTRRAATEVANDAGVRFLQIQNILIPEPLPGQPLTMNGALAMVSNLAPLFDDKPAEPLAAPLRELASRGRVGAVVTQQEMSPALDAVRVTISLWVRDGDHWTRAGSRTASVRADALRPGAGDDLAQDPQVGAVFQVFESIGFGFSPEVKQRSLNIGAATRKALGLARAAFSDSLAARLLPLEGGEEGGDRPAAR